MFTCFANYLHQYGQDMENAGVYWQRQGGAAAHPDQQRATARHKMVFEMCFDYMPAPKDPKDPCYPITNSAEYTKYVHNTLDQNPATLRVVELFNEPNTGTNWTLAAYANLLKVYKDAVRSHPYGKDLVIGTGGVTTPYVGYLDTCMQRVGKDVFDIILCHPYCVDEPLDSQLNAITDMCRKNGRPDMAVAINEIGFPTWDPATKHPINEWFVSEKDQATKIIKTHLQAIAHRLSFVTYLAWNDLQAEPSDQAKNMGLVRVDGTAKPALQAYRFMTGTLGRSPTIAQFTYQNDCSRIYRINVAGRKPVWAVWNAVQDKKVTVDTGDVEIFLYDIMGTKLTVIPAKGKVQVLATDEPVYLVAASDKE